jgi:uncharacterized protein (TIGR03437 family)
MKTFVILACLTSVLAPVCSAQVFDSSGNNQLNGAYFFREVSYKVNASGTVVDAVVVYGTATFDGNGSYTINGLRRDTTSGSGNYSTSGTYSISASGYGFLKHPYYDNSRLQVLVSGDKALIGSSPDSSINDILIAVPVSSVNNSTLNGPYSIAYFNPAFVSSNTAATLTADGSGGISGVSFKSYFSNQIGPVMESPSGSASYEFSNNVGTLQFPSGGSAAIRGDRIIYSSPDGAFIFGGTAIDTTNSNASEFDILVGVRRGSTAAPPLSGLFYQAGLSQGQGSFYTYYGAFSATNGIILDHRRFLATTAIGGPANSTVSSSSPTSPTTNYTDSSSPADYVVSQDSRIRIGTGQSPILGLHIGLRTSDLSSFAPPDAGPYIHPMGVTNAASFAPFTAGVAPGELINIYGANFAAKTTDVVGGTQFPTTLDGVQVLANDRLASLRFVTPNQIVVVVPWETAEPVVQFQVIKNGVRSNVVTSFLYQTAPGIFALSRNGVGPGTILHADAPNFTPVSSNAPAQRGEIVQVFVAGLGAVSPAVADGAPGGFNPLNQTPSFAVGAFVDGVRTEVTYSGLAPGLSGLYQVNVRIPESNGSGDVRLDIITFRDAAKVDAYTSQATVNVAPTASVHSTTTTEVSPFSWLR